MCPNCNSVEIEIIGKPQIDSKLKNLVKKNYNVVQCKKCEYYFVNPKLDFSKEEWGMIYDSEYFNPLTKWHAKRREIDRIKRLKKLESYVDSQVQTFLDVGCGEGNILLKSIQNGWRTFGVDVVDNRIRDARISEIYFTKGDLLDAKYPSHYFDCIYLDSILEHVTNPRNYISEVYRILKTGGVIYIGVPNEDSLQNIFKTIRDFFAGERQRSSKIKPFVSPYHIGGFNKKSLKYILKKEMFEIVEFRNFATRMVFLLTKFPSKDFIKGMGLTVIYLIAFILRKEYYLEVYAKKRK